VVAERLLTGESDTKLYAKHFAHSVPTPLAEARCTFHSHRISRFFSATFSPCKGFVLLYNRCPAAFVVCFKEIVVPL
jgi:hypothetical protein